MTIKDEKKLKICDFYKKGNVIRLYLTNLDDDNYSGDDWDDSPYEHNAGMVSYYGYYPYIEFAFPLDIWITEPADDYHYRGNSPFCKDDFKARKAPCLIIGDLGEDWHDSYSEQMGNQNLLRIYFNDKLSDILPVVAEWGGLILFKSYLEDSNGER
jgi:hypothetical protein